MENGVMRFMDEVKCDSAPVNSVSESDQPVQLFSDGSRIDNSASQKEAEIVTLSDLLNELEKKLEDLQQLALNPKSILSELPVMASAKAKGDESNGSATVINSSQMAISTTINGCFGSPTVSTANIDYSPAVTHLGVVGRGVKRVLMNPEPTEPDTKRKATLDQSQDQSACKQCGKSGWGGCGKHLPSLYAGIKKGDHCLCRAWPGVATDSDQATAGEKAKGSSSAANNIVFIVTPIALILIAIFFGI